MVDALEQIADAGATLIVNDTVGVVDVAAAVGLGTQEFAGDVEVARNGADVVLWFHAQSFSG
jgi:hypothetical protein